MGNNFNLDIKCGLPGRRTAMPLLFMLLLCVPAVADNVGTTKVNTYYPLSYGSFPQPIVSQKFEMKILALRTNNACVQATLAVSSAGGFNNINVTGGVFALGGNSIELAPSGSGGRVNVGSAYIDNMLMWINSNSVGAYSTNTSVTGPGGPYWTPICNGVSLGQGGDIADIIKADTGRFARRQQLGFGWRQLGKRCLEVFIFGRFGFLLP